MRAALIRSACLLSLLVAQSASAVWTTVDQTSYAQNGCALPGTGVGSGPRVPVDELGISSVFPAGEQIATSAATTSSSTCGQNDDPLIPNAIVSMTNLNQIRFDGLTYVPSVGTTMSLGDVMYNGVPSLFIGNGPGRTVLVSESISSDGFFDPGETWTFIIQDYANASLLPADAIAAIGVPDVIGSSGSIISFYAEVVPEPGTSSLVVAGLLAVAGWRRARA